MHKWRGHTQPRVVIGLVLIAIALLVFLNNIGIRLLGYILSQWPLVLIVIGALLLYRAKRHPSMHAGFGPYALIAVGTLFFLVQRGLFNLSFHSVLAPLVIFGVGLYLLNPQRTNFKKSLFNFNKPNDDSESLPPPNDERLDIYAILGGGNYTKSSQELSGGNIFCLMGGADLDLREADFIGSTMQLDIVALMGGADIKIPPHWQVSLKVLPLLGGVSDKSVCLADKIGVPKKTLVVSGVACMGGINIRN
ncbi:LiaF transmembrane domain-containing protein [Teredinibacter turnerae]|uniref:LiaF transmembrane domain-containing protein n=1 Tax=Teredinibacter turnerae TaxID=2426 RepID=UPI0003695E39|nr:hypothetical protein [Teredinibacter turnerae]